MSAQLLTKWYGIYKLQETMGALQADLARLAADPHDAKPIRNLVERVSLKMADVMAALQWFEYRNKLDVDPDRMEYKFQQFDASHLKPVEDQPGQTHMRGILTSDPEFPDLVISLGQPLQEDKEPETLPGTDSTPPPSSPPSAEVTHGSR